MAAVDVAGELATLFPVSRSVTIAGRMIELKPLGIGRASRIAEMAAPILAVRDGDISFFEWIEQFPEEANPLIVVATGLDADWVAGLSAVDRADLATHLQEQNAAFFVQRLLPIMARKRRATEAWNGVGPTPSSSSSQPDMPTPRNTPPPNAAPTSRPSVEPSSALATAA